MFASTTPCCATTIQQQQDQVTRYAEQDDDCALARCKQSKQNCTVVENGRVVVKPRSEVCAEAESASQ